jgi:beta-N-acetylhexosaminidase
LFALVSAQFEPVLRAQAPHYAPYNHKLTAVEERWVERNLASMTLDEKIGQLVATDASGVFMSRDGEAYRRLQRHIVERKVGCVILFRSEVWASAILVNRLQHLARLPLLVSADLEMGPGMRFDDTVWWAPNMAVGATGDIEWARKQGRATAIEGRAIGVNWLYAPVADINNNPGNPVINTRSFGENPETVSRFVVAFIEGAQGAGSLATAKHFPGHGDTAVDSHIGLPVVDVSRERLDKIELVPFRAAIHSGVGAIMSAHIALPQIEPQLAPPVRALSDRERETSEFVSVTESASQVTMPGTLSRKVMTDLLRTDLSFKGLVTTDALSMAGVAARFDPGTSAVLAVKAGADIVLKSPDVDVAIAAIKAAVTKGEIGMDRVDSSVRRILRAKVALGLNKSRYIDLDKVDEIVSSADSAAIAQEIADRSMTLVRDEKKLFPLGITSKTGILSVTITDEEDRSILLPFLQELRKRSTSVESVTIDTRSKFGETEKNSLRQQVTNAKLVILSVVVRARSGKGSLALPAVGELVLQELLDGKTPVVTVSFGNPYLLQGMPQVPAYLAAYSIVPVSQRAAARALLGEIDINGHLPVSLPGLYPIGHGIRVARSK